MELQLFGINHKTSDVSEREKFIINESNQILLDSHLKNIFNAKLESMYAPAKYIVIVRNPSKIARLDYIMLTDL